MILLAKLSGILSRERPPVRAPLLTSGLNEVHKREERDRIDRENQQLLRRLHDVRAYTYIDAAAVRSSQCLPA